jgi:hypothetical protein
MRKLLLILGLLLAAAGSSPPEIRAQVTTGWVERTNCADILLPQLYLYCKQTTTTGGRTAGSTYYWNGSSWILQGGSGGGASDFSELTGAATDAQIPNTITIDAATTAATATALVSNPTDCATGAFAHTIAASGNLTCSILVVTSASAPTANDDTGDGYIVGTKWINTTADTIYEAVDVTLTAAVWKPVVTTGTANEITVTANTISLADAIRDLSGRHGIDSGSTDTYVASLTTADSAYKNGALYSLDPNTQNTGQAFVNLNGLGNVGIKKWVSGSKVDPADGDICARQKILMQYDGTHMILQSPLCNPASGSISATTGTILKAGSATSGEDSSIIEDGDSVNFSKAVEICPTTCLFTLDTSVFSASAKTWGFPANQADTFVGAASAGTLTNKTIDTEGTGNVITTKSKVWLPAVGGTAAAPGLLWDTLASNAPSAVCSAGTTETTLLRCTADFPDSDGDYSLQQPIMLPSDWAGAIDLVFKYRMVGTTGSVVWQAATACRADAEVDDVAFNAVSTVTDAAKGTTLQLNDAAITGLTTTGCAAGELMHLKVQRNRTHASDDATGVISLVGVEMTLRRAQ